MVLELPCELATALHSQSSGIRAVLDIEEPLYQLQLQTDY